VIDAPRANVFERVFSTPRLRIEQALGQLQPRERQMVLGAAAILLLLIVWLAVVTPITTALDRLDRQVAQTRRDAATVADLLARYRTLRNRVDALERGMAGEKAEASLFAQLESFAVPIVGRERITSMNPASRPVGDKFQEESVELHLEGVTTRELVSLLHAIELGNRPIRLVRVSFKREYKNQAMLDATLVVARLRAR
jgi:hypothetical protein